mgnify:CR=1 FL=1
MQRPDERELREQLARLRAEHRDLDSEIVAEEISPLADQLQIKRLKKRKLGLKDQIIFPEVDYAKVDKLRGMNVTFVTSARTDEESQLLLKYLGMPFKSGQQEGR